MDPRLAVDDDLRELSAGLPDNVSLLSIAWRVASEQCRQQFEETQKSRHEAERVHRALASIAQQAFRLRRLVRNALSTSQSPDHEPTYKELEEISKHMVDALAAADVSIVAPVDEPYTAELMELIENVAQRTAADIIEPRIAEIIAPAILHGQSLLRMGKAVIAIPDNSDKP